MSLFSPIATTMVSSFSILSTYKKKVVVITVVGIEPVGKYVVLFSYHINLIYMSVKIKFKTKQKTEKRKNFFCGYL